RGVLVAGEVGDADGDGLLQPEGFGDGEAGGLEHGVAVGGQGAAPAEGGHVLVDGGPVEPDGPLDGGGGDGQAAVLVGGADEQHVGRHVVVEERLGQAVCVDVEAVAGGGPDAGEGVGGGAGHRRAAGDHLGGGHDRGVDDGDGPVGGGGGEVGVGGGAEQVEADEHVGGAAGGPGRAGEGPVGDAHVADDRAALLRQAGLFQPGGVQAVEVGGHLQDLGDGDDAGAADAGHPDEDGAAD